AEWGVGAAGGTWAREGAGAAAVPGGRAVVAHHPVVSRRYHLLGEVLGDLAVHVGLVEPPAVDVDDALARLDRFARKGDYALDEIAHVGILLLRRPFEHDHVTTVDRVEVVAE